MRELKPLLNKPGGGGTSILEGREVLFSRGGRGKEWEIDSVYPANGQGRLEQAGEGHHDGQTQDSGKEVMPKRRKKDLT